MRTGRRGGDSRPCCSQAEHCSWSPLILGVLGVRANRRGTALNRVEAWVVVVLSSATVIATIAVSIWVLMGGANRGS